MHGLSHDVPGQVQLLLTHFWGGTANQLPGGPARACPNVRGPTAHLRALAVLKQISASFPTIPIAHNQKQQKKHSHRANIALAPMEKVFRVGPLPLTPTNMHKVSRVPFLFF